MQRMLAWLRRAPGPMPAEELEALRARARALPHESEPQRDLWLEIRNRIEMERASPPERTRIWRARVQVPVWAASAAAALLLGVAIGTGVWFGRPPSLDDPAAVRALADSLRV